MSSSFAIDWSHFDKLLAGLETSVKDLKRLDHESLGDPSRLNQLASDDHCAALCRLGEDLSRLQALVAEPSSFINRLTTQVK